MTGGPGSILIRQAGGSLEIVQARELFVEYAAWLNVDLGFQDFATELANLPGDYAPPRGCLLLALADGQAAGCVALRPLKADESSGEVKRLWVRPPFRGLGIGKRLIDQVIESARSAGHARLVLDTLPRMQSAIALYRAAGFQPIPPYYDNPIPETTYFALNLRAEAR